MIVTKENGAVIDIFWRILTRVIGEKKVYLFKSMYRRFFLMAFGLSPSRGRIDRTALEYCDKIDNGFFVEVGAADGVQQSNTIWLEKKKNWNGLLIEPTVFQYGLLARTRSNNILINCALVAEENKKTADIVQLGLASITSEQGDNVKNIEDQIQRFSRYSYDANASKISANARTFSSIANQYGVDRIDFFSLDVEGYEKEVLRGIDFERIFIDVFVIETDEFEGVFEILQKYYRLIKKINQNDYLFKRRI